MKSVEIIDLRGAAGLQHAAADVLLAAFRNLALDAWPTLESARDEVVGVVPDANGFGRPDILMAKRVGRTTRRDGKEIN